jgi:hypothetical protein
MFTASDIYELKPVSDDKNFQVCNIISTASTSEMLVNFYQTTQPYNPVHNLKITELRPYSGCQSLDNVTKYLQVQHPKRSVFVYLSSVE